MSVIESLRASIQKSLSDHERHLKTIASPMPKGRVTRSVGLTIEAVGCRAPIGTRCLVTADDGEKIEAEIVGFNQDTLTLMSPDVLHGIAPGAPIMPLHRPAMVPVGDGLLGRIIDGAGGALDNLGHFSVSEIYPLMPRPINPLSRGALNDSLDVGIEAINGLFTVARGQRMGLFAGSGVGKSILMGMMTRYTAADIIVVALIGERGREVVEFIQEAIGPEAMSRTVVVAVPADHPPLLRLQGAYWATSIAEYFRDTGKNVLLLMDSLTRFAQAQREIALAVGEPPATKGYPPSVFTKLPQLVERAGNLEQSNGSITAFYTVLMEGDDDQDPIADAARAILDGHLMLSRKLASTGLYPAIDIEYSISRAMTRVVTPEHLQAASQFKHLYSYYEQHRDLIQIGAYVKGSDPTLDLAIEWYPKMIAYLKQDLNSLVPFQTSIDHLLELMANLPEASTTQQQALVTQPQQGKS